MKHLLVLLTAILAFTAFAPAQTATDLNEGSTFSYDSASGTCNFTWWGRTGRTYFVQMSDDLIHWVYFNEIVSGGDAVTGYGFSSSANLFVRLRYSDIPTTDPANASFGGDGIPNEWKLTYGLDPLANDSTGDEDGDGILDVEEYWLGTNPNQAADTSPSAAASVALVLYTELN